MHKNENRPGYKNSKVGWIPVGWDGLLWGQVLSLTSGKPRPQNTSNDKSLIPVFGGNGVMGYSTLSNNDGENLMIGRVGEKCGCVHRYSGKCWITDNALFVTEYKRKADIPFLFYSLFHLKLNRFKNEAGQPLVSQQLIYDIGTALPPLPEQKAIAGVLECWDRGIRNLEFKIEKKRLIKNGLMQRLLSGKQRLKGFTEAWKNVRLSEVATVNEKTLGQNTEEDYEFYYIDLTCVNEGTITLPPTKIKFSNAPSRARRRFKRSDVLMATVRPNLLGHCYVNFDADDKICSTGFAVISARQGLLDNRFFYAHLFGEKLNTDIQNLLTGSSYPSINSTDVENISFDLPPLDEQQAIAGVLSAADGEIAALEKKLALWKEQKKYLLNNLVTGTIRLPQFCVKA